QQVAFLGDEGAPDLPADLGANRDVLQVRVAAAQTAGSGYGLVEGRVDAARVGVHELGEGVDVGALQLHQPAPFEDLARQVVREGELFEDLDGRRRRAGGPCPLQHRQLQLVEQHLG